MIVNDRLISSVLSVVLERAKSCLASETGVVVDDVRIQDGVVDKLILREVTAVIAIGGRISFLAAFSFERPLLEALFQAYTADIDVDEGERAEFVHATAGDLVNLVMGQSTADLESTGAVLTVSPPIVFQDARKISRYKSALFRSAEMHTAKGILDISIVGPSELFDQRLNYVK